MDDVCDADAREEQWEVDKLQIACDEWFIMNHVLRLMCNLTS